MVILLTFLSSLFVTVLILSTKKFHIDFSSDTLTGAQKMHSGSVPRIGGVAVLTSLVLAGLYDAPLSFWAVMSAALPLALTGLAEDVLNTVSSKVRLLSALISAGIFVFYSGYHFTHIDIYPVDRLFNSLSLWPALTVIAIAALTNGINIIDGYNGLASGAAMFMFGGLAVLGYSAGDTELVLLIFVFMASISGFLLVNFPSGKIFLGDAGAYFIGFSLAAVSVLLLARNPGIPPLSLLVVFSYPITELLFSIIRKTSRKGHRFDQPDRVHFHMLAYRRLKHSQLLAFLNPNARTGLMLQIMPFSGFIWLAVTPENRFYCLLYFLIFVLSYLRWYRKLSLNG